MTEMTRRAMLGVGAAAMPLIATSFYKAAAPPVMPPSGLLPFADRTAELPQATLQSLQERLEAAIATAADCLREMNAAPGLELLVERSDGWVFIGTRTPPKPGGVERGRLLPDRARRQAADLLDRARRVQDQAGLLLSRGYAMEGARRGKTHSH